MKKKIIIGILFFIIALAIVFAIINLNKKPLEENQELVPPVNNEILKNEYIEINENDDWLSTLEKKIYIAILKVFPIDYTFNWNFDEEDRYIISLRDLQSKYNVDLKFLEEEKDHICDIEISYLVIKKVDNEFQRSLYLNFKE